MIVGMGLDQFTEQICEISGAARKELSIEEGLAAIDKVWNETKLEIKVYKDRGHHTLSATDEVTTKLINLQ